MKNHLKLVWAAMVAMTLSACSERISFEQATDSDRKNEYTKAWIQSIGLIPADQDWCMIDAVTANISTDGLENGTVTKIYTSDPKDGGRLKATITDSGTAYLDVREGTTELYAMIYNSDGVVVAQGLCSIDNGVTAITPSTLSPKRMSRHVDDFMTPVTFDAIIVCEDLGTIGDFDFNDIVLGLTTETVEGEKHLKIYPLAAGGILTANILFGDGKVDKGEIHELMQDNDVNPEGKFYNTTSFDKNGSVIDIKVASTWTIANKWNDIKIRVQSDTNTAYEISVAPAGSAPEMICLSGDFFWPKEGISIKTAYTDFVLWATGGYKGNDLNYSWLDNKTDAKVVPWEIKIPGEHQNYFIATCENGTTEYTYKDTPYASGQRVYVDGRTNLSGMFFGYYNDTDDFSTKIISIDVNGSHFDTSNVTNMTAMFQGCESLSTLDVSNWDVSKVKDMNSMFQYCESLTSLDISNWDVSKVKDMNSMFNYCQTLTTLDLGNWDVSNVNDMTNMFADCNKLTSINVSNWNVSNVSYTDYMFYNCPDNLEITCKSAFRDWCINNKKKIGLPSGLQSESSTQWHIVD